MSVDCRQYFSDRGFPLLFYGMPTVPVITAENYVKWYALYVVHPDGRVERLNYDALEGACASSVSAYHDHDPNPEVVEAYAEEHGWTVDEVSLDVMRARWMDS